MWRRSPWTTCAKESPSIGEIRFARRVVTPVLATRQPRRVQVARLGDSAGARAARLLAVDGPEVSVRVDNYEILGVRPCRHAETPRDNADEVVLGSEQLVAQRHQQTSRDLHTEIADCEMVPRFFPQR